MLQSLCGIGKARLQALHSFAMFYNSVVALALLAILAPHVAAECVLTDKGILDTTRVYFIELDNKFDLLLLDSVPDKARLHLVCADRTLAVYTCNGNAFDRPVTLQNCADEQDLRSSVEVIEADGSCIAPFVNYRVGYTYNGRHFEVYRSCFNPKTKSPVFVTHRKYHFSITSKGPKVGFGPAPVVNIPEAVHLKQENSLATLQNLLDKNDLKAAEKEQLQIDRGHLAPSMDFMFSKHKGDTYRYVNIVPQFAKNNKGNWNTVELSVYGQSNLKLSQRKKMQPRPRTSFHIITGGHDLLELNHKTRGLIPIYLLNTNGFPMPKWIYKIVSDGSACTIYVTYNNVLDAPSPDPFCETVGCPSRLKLNKDDRVLGEIYCCDVSDFRARNIVPNLDICQ